MFDFIRLRIPESAIPQLKEVLNFIDRVNTSTGEIVKTEGGYSFSTAKYKYFKVELWEHSTKRDKAYLFGSMHKCVGNGTNYENISQNQFKQGFKTLLDDLHLNPKELVLNGFEWGYNMNLEELNTTYVLNSIITKSSAPPTIQNYRNGKQVCFEHQRFKLKIYDKGKQNNLNINLLRFELKITRMAYLKDKGVKITTLQDLLDPSKNTIEILNSSLLYQLSKIVFSIDFDFDKITNNKESAYTIKRQKLSYWQNLSNKNYNKNLGAYRKTINNYSLDYLGHVLRDKLILAIEA